MDTTDTRHTYIHEGLKTIKSLQNSNQRRNSLFFISQDFRILYQLRKQYNRVYHFVNY